MIPKLHVVTFVTSAANIAVSQAQPYYFQSNAPPVLGAFLGHRYDREPRGLGVQEAAYVSQGKRGFVPSPSPSSLAFGPHKCLAVLSDFLLPKE